MLYIKLVNRLGSGGGVHVLRLQESSYETFQTVSFAGDEVLVHNQFSSVAGVRT